MTSTVAEIARELLGLSTAQRSSRIAELAVEDPALAAELARQFELLDARVTAVPGAEPIAPSNAPDHLGPYRLIERLGSGGMGTVWLAEQAQPRRLVALKTIRPEMLSDKLRERFEHEARFLAALSHPAIARIYEAGSSWSENGETPWLAMEHVDGIDLLSHAQDRKLDLKARLQLLITIAEGVQHAHTRGVIHRDLKPGNILVERGSSAPKILDFGIAKAIDSSGPVVTRLTRAGELVGTIQYMSPEQLSGDATAVDLRSDVYALGVIAYELLTQALPHDVSQLSLIEAIQHICETPPKALARLRPAYAGDLDTIVMKALAADPGQRYQSAQALIDDLQNCLAHRPIRARPPSSWYLLGKFVRRHRALVAASALALVALLGATAWSLVAAERAERARAEAEARAQELAAVNDFVGQMLTGADPELGGNIETPLREVLQAAERTLDQFADRPRTAGLVALLLGRTWGGLGATDRAQPLLKKAMEMLATGFGTDSNEALDAHVALAAELGRAGELDAAIQAFEAILASIKRLPGVTPAIEAQANAEFAQVIQAQGDAARAIEMLRQAESRFAEMLSTSDPDALDGIRYNLAYALLFTGQFKEAETRLRAVVADETARLGPKHPQTLYSIKALGQSLHRQGRLDEALQFYQMVHAERRQIYGTEHPATLNSATQLASAYSSLKRPAEAEPILRETLAARDQRGEQAHPQTIAVLNILASSLEQLQRRDEALQLLDRAIATEREHGPNQETIASRNIHASMLTRAGQLEACDREFDQLIQMMPTVIGTDHVNYALFISNATACDLARKDFSQARARLESVLPKIEAQFGPDHPRTVEARARLVAAKEQ